MMNFRGNSKNGVTTITMVLIVIINVSIGETYAQKDTISDKDENGLIPYNLNHKAVIINFDMFTKFPIFIIMGSLHVSKFVNYLILSCFYISNFLLTI
jgi:hypothetical protein